VSIASVVELFEEQSGLETVGFQREYVTVYHVTTNDQNDGPQIVVDADGLPVIGNQYTGVGNDEDLNAYCVSLTPTRVPGSLYLWRVVAKWTTIPGPGLGGEGSASRKIKVNKDLDEPTDDPIEFHDEMEVSSASYTAPVEKAKYIDGFHSNVENFRAPNSLGPVINSALAVYDPPIEKDDTRMVVRVTRNLRIFPWNDAKKYRDAVNSDTFTINRVAANHTFQPFTCKITSIQGTFQITNGVPNWKVTYEFQVKEETWRYEVVDRGVVAGAREGDPNGRGGTISASDIVTGVPQVRRMTDPSGLPITEPVLLDGNGQPKAPEADTVYITYAIYNEYPFAALGI
jgi:hypothetical protein